MQEKVTTYPLTLYEAELDSIIRHHLHEIAGADYEIGRTGRISSILVCEFTKSSNWAI